MENPIQQQRNDRFKKVKLVTLPVLKLRKDHARYLAILTPMRLGKKLDDKREAATICEALDMETGELGVLVIPTIMQKELTAGYPNDGYLRKGFEIVTSMDKDEGDGKAKKYNHVSLVEVAIPEDIKLPHTSMFARDPATGYAQAPETPNKAKSK